MHYFWHVKNMYLKDVKTLWKNVFFEAILKLCSSSLCIWLYVFAPGSHCFAIDILNNRSAICTIHFRSIWTAPLRFSTCRSFGRQQSNCSKTGPQKIKVPPSQLDVQMCFFTCFAFFSFLPNAFSKRFSHFFQAHFQNAFFHILWKMWKMRIKCVLKTGLEKSEKCVLKMWKNASNMWRHVKKGNKRQLKSSCFLAPCFPCVFSRYRFFFKFSLKSNFKL